MAHGNGRIYIDSSTGVSLLGDIREVFGLPYNHVSKLITEAISRGLVNKWAKYKPIHYPGKIPLEDADFRGRSVDTNDHGLVYGLKVPAQVSVIVPSAFHNTTWDYLGYPNAPGLSGSSLYRALDFNGYSENALPDIYGLIPSTSKFYVGTDDAGIVTANSVVNEGYRTNNQYGVPLARYVVDGITLTDNQLMARLAKCYPAILIGNYLTGVGVYNPTTGDVDYGTIVRANGSSWVVAADSWCVDMRKEDSAGNRPWTADTSTVATLVLVYTASANPYLVNGDPTTDLTQYWHDMTQERAWTARIFPLPGACGVSINIKRYQAPGYTVTPREVTSCTANDVTVLFDVVFVGDTPTLGLADVDASVGAGGQSVSKRVPIRIGDSTTTATFTASEFGMAMFMPGTTYSMTLTVVATPGGNQVIRTINFSRT